MRMWFSRAAGNSSTSTGVTVTAPSGPNLAPRGYYMLFILNRNGVPSTGLMVKVQ